MIAATLGAFIALRQYRLQKRTLELAEQERDRLQRERDSINQQYQVLRKVLTKGPKAFVQKFGTLIQSAREASSQGPGERNLIPRAQAIVSQRNSLQDELGGLESLLNSDIDTLSGQLKQPNPNWNEVRDCIETLSVKWTQKEVEIALRIKRLMAALEVVLDVDQLNATNVDASREHPRSDIA